MAENHEIDLRRFFRSARKLKWLYLASLLVFLGLVISYALISQPKYTIKSTMLIEDQEGETPQIGGNLNSMMRMFSIGGFGASSVDNELLLVNSYDLMLRTVKRLGLNITYTQTDGLKKKTLFNDSPVTAMAPYEMLDTLANGFNIKVKLHDGKADIEAYQGWFLKHTLAEAENASLPCTVSTPYGDIKLTATEHYSPDIDKTITIGIVGYGSMAHMLYDEVRTDVSSKTADGIDFEVKDANTMRGKAFLNALMDEYNNKRIDRKHATAHQELDFLDERIALLANDLADSEKKVESYKYDNKTVDLSSEAPLIFENALDAKNELLKLQSDILYYEQVTQSLDDPDHERLLPMASMITTGNKSVIPLVEQYNAEVINRQNLRRSAKPGNHALESSTERIDHIHSAISKDVGQLLLSARANYKGILGSIGESTSRLNNMPRIERELTDLIRDKQIKNELYLYLLQKRESALLQLSATGSPGFIIDSAYASMKPSRSKVMAIFGIAILLALAIPSALALIHMRRNDKVTDQTDLHAAGLENRCIVYDGEQSSINRLRMSIMGHSVPEAIYVADFCNSAIVEKLTSALESIGINVVAPQPTPTDNDLVQTPKFRNKIASMASTDGDTCVMVRLASPERVAEISRLISATSPLLIIIAPGVMPRQDIKLMCSGIDGNCLTIAIDNSSAI